MKGLAPLFLGIFGTFAFSWLGLTVVPNAQIGHLDPQMDEEGNDAYPAPKSGMAERGRQVYRANGCVYCHSQQVRADYVASDIERKWGERRSAPRDYIFDRPVLLGKMRIGPDLSNIGKRAPVDDENAPPPGSTNVSPAPSPAVGTAAAPAPQTPPAANAPPTGAVAVAAPAANNAPNAGTPASAGSPPAPPAATGASPAPATAAATAAAAPAASPATEKTALAQYSAAWHHRHLYDPRSVVADSIMPSYRFLYEKRRVTGERAADAVIGVTNPADEGWEVVPTYDAECLVAYLMSLDQSHALNEVKSTAPASPPAPGKAAK